MTVADGEAYKECVCVWITQRTQTVLIVPVSRYVPECQFDVFSFHVHIKHITLEDGGDITL
jgi:hypothetical protein